MEGTNQVEIRMPKEIAYLVQFYSRLKTQDHDTMRHHTNSPNRKAAKGGIAMRLQSKLKHVVDPFINQFQAQLICDQN